MLLVGKMQYEEKIINDNRDVERKILGDLKQEENEKKKSKLWKEVHLS